MKRLHAKIKLGAGVSGVDHVEYHSTADLSSRQRSQLTDEMVALLKATIAQVDHQRSEMETLTATAREHRAMLDAHAGVVLRPTLLGRLRWLVMGC